MRVTVTLDEDLLKIAHEYTGVTGRAELFRKTVTSTDSPAPRERSKNGQISSYSVRMTGNPESNQLGRISTDKHPYRHQLPNCQQYLNNHSGCL